MNLVYNIQLNDSEKSYFFQLSHTGSDSKESTFSENIEGLSKKDIDLLLSIVGREALREKRPNLQQLDQIIKSLLELDNDTDKESPNGQDAKDNSQEDKVSRDQSTPFPIIRMLLQEGYLKDDEKWLTSRGFSRIGNLILDDVMKALKLGEAGAHSTKKYRNRICRIGYHS